MRTKKNMKVINKNIKICLRVLLVLVCLMTITQAVYGASLENTKLVTGTENLVKAIINWLMGIGITVCGGYFVYYVYCLKTNDEGERMRNIQNIKNTLISMVLITTGLAVIDAILGFYK